MPRSITGVYTLPEAAFVAGTVIQSAPVNSDFSDIASALTQSLATTGVTAMTGPIKAFAGTVTAPSYAYANALGTGFYLAGTNQMGWTANGTLAALFNADGSTDWAQDAAFAHDVAADTLTVATSATIAGHPVTNFPSATVMLFRQTAAPTGWTKSATDNNKGLRVVTGTVGSGGSVGFSTVFGYTAVTATTLTQAQTPAHTHFVSNLSNIVGVLLTSLLTMSRTANWSADTSYQLSGDAGAASTGISSSIGSSASHDHAIDMQLQYIDVIVATKN